MGHIGFCPFVTSLPVTNVYVYIQINIDIYVHVSLGGLNLGTFYGRKLKFGMLLAQT